MGIVIPPKMLEQMHRARDPSIAAAEYQQLFNQSAGTSIPGLTGPTTPMGLNGRGYVPGTGTGQTGGFRINPGSVIGPALSQYMNNEYTPADWRGMLPNPAPAAGPTIPAAMQPNGPYGQQAMMLAGLLGHQPTPQMPTSGYHGLLGRRMIPGAK